jgi:hypothetical protein
MLQRIPDHIPNQMSFLVGMDPFFLHRTRSKLAPMRQKGKRRGGGREVQVLRAISLSTCCVWKQVCSRLR